MADEQPAKAKRQVKNPETFRERVLKASEAAGQSNTRGSLKRATSTAFNTVLQPISRLLKTVFALPPFRLLAKPLRPIGKVLGRILLVNHFRRSWQELRQVSWPGWPQSWRLTLAVLIFAIIFGAVIAGVDYGMEKAFRKVLLN